MSDYCLRVLEEVKNKNPEQAEFIQAVTEVLSSIKPVLAAHPEYEDMAILERLIEPERLIQFRVPWRDDSGKLRVNRGYRIQFNGALGPYKGGLRFNPSVNQGILKFLAFEQIFKNALTTLPIGGGKGGSDFDPKGKSDAEVYRFCFSFMSELYRHIGPDTDVPAGDMGVGAREIGYLYGAYRRLKGVSEAGVLTGKAVNYGGSWVRTEATGYGLIYMVEAIAKANDIDLTGRKTIISGCGNVGIHALEKAQQLNLNVIAISDSQGYLVSDDLDLALIKEIKTVRRSTLKDYLEVHPDVEYREGSIYDGELKAEIILPCGKENEIDKTKAERLAANGALIIAEGANMPSDEEALKVYFDNKILFCPGKAANAGGVATSGLEMAQNSMRLKWSFEEVDAKLKGIMTNIHAQMKLTMDKYGLADYDYVSAANITAFEKVVNAMIAQGDY